jgi:hypothetical protein
VGEVAGVVAVPDEVDALAAGGHHRHAAPAERLGQPLRGLGPATGRGDPDRTGHQRAPEHAPANTVTAALDTAAAASRFAGESTVEEAGRW